MPSRVLTLAIDSCLEHVALVGVAVRAIASDVGLDDEHAAQVELAVVEGVTNAIEHAYGGASGHRVDVRVTAVGQRLTIDIADSGIAMEWEAACAASARRIRADPLAEGGRGLLIMRQAMDEVAYRRDGERNVLSLTKRLAAAC